MGKFEHLNTNHYLTNALGWLGLTPVIKLVTVLAKSDPADHAETRAYVFLTTECFYTKGCRSHATLLSELVLIFDLSCPAYHATGLRLLAAPFDQVPPLVWGNFSTKLKLSNFKLPWEG